MGKIYRKDVIKILSPGKENDYLEWAMIRSAIACSTTHLSSS